MVPGFEVNSFALTEPASIGMPLLLTSVQALFPGIYIVRQPLVILVLTNDFALFEGDRQRFNSGY